MKFDLRNFIFVLVTFCCFMSGVLASEESESQHAVVVILFMFIGLLLCNVIAHVISVYNDVVPYTVVVFLFGAAFATLLSTKFSAFTDSLDQWVNIDAYIMLYVFLPVLIFGEAMNLNWHHVTGGLFQAFLLAGPGVLMGAGIMGTAVHFILPSSYGWSWNLCMTFGAILAATDPVAVVALLKDAGAPPKLTILIVGESLMNDGTAMVLFSLFFNMYKGRSYTGGEVILFFFEAALGSPLVGIVMGLMAVKWLRLANRPLKESDSTIQIVITVCCAYLVFFVAQYTLEISGVLACCGAGLMLAWLAPPLILKHETMHNVWSFIEWLGNTLIFLIAGLIMGNRTLHNIDLVDWLIMPLLYLVLMSSRVFVIMCMYPLLSTTGHKCTFSEACFMAWSGLRGALAIALAVIVDSSPEISNNNGDRFLFYVGGIAALTIIVNGTLAKSMLLYLGLIGNDETQEKTLIMNQIRKRLRGKMGGFVENLEAELSADIVHDIRRSCTLFNQDESQVSKMSDPDDDLMPVPMFVPTCQKRSSIKDMMPGSLKEMFESTESSSVASGSQRLNSEDSREKNNLISNIDVSGTGIVRHTSARARSRTASFKGRSRVGSLSVQFRGPNAEVIPEVLAYVRTVFLELVRVKYWQLIESGKLPRLSHTAQFLLYSVDVGVDEVYDINGLRDWNAIEEHLEYVPFYIKLLMNLFGASWGFSTGFLAWFLSRREKRAVYILTSFIEAHEHAQSKIHAFLGGGAVQDDVSAQTPEELRVKTESMALVEKARACMQFIPDATIAGIRTKQAARALLSKEVELIKHMVEEGLLSEKHAEQFLQEISDDAAKIEKQRKALYRQQAQATEERLTTAMQTDALDLESLDSLAFRPSLMESNRVSAVAGSLKAPSALHSLFEAHRESDDTGDSSMPRGSDVSEPLLR